MSQVVMTHRQALRIVAQFVLPEQADGPGEPHLDAEIHEQIFEPARALEAVMHQLAMTAE